MVVVLMTLRMFANVFYSIMLKLIVLGLVSLPLTFAASAQTLQRQSLLSSSGDNDAFTYSLGDPVAFFVSSGGISLAAGSQPGEEVITGLQNQQQVGSFSVYPNPFSAKLTVQLSPTNPLGQAQLFSADGKELVSQSISHQGTLLVGALPKGAYLLRLTQGAHTRNQLLVKAE